jgi:deoxyribose-phosphate aldolase
MVLNVGALKSGNLELVYRDIGAVAQVCRARSAVLKVIIEAALLSDEEKVAACMLAQSAGADYVKTSTGFASGGATAEDIAMIREVVGPELGIKASGGVKDFADAEKMVFAGATRIGASAGVKIIQGEREKTGTPLSVAA